MNPLTANPHHRVVAAQKRVAAAQKAVTSGKEDPLVRALEQALCGKWGEVPAEVTYAYRLYSSDYRRTVMEAFLLAGDSGETLATVLEIPQKVVEVYRYLFVDMSVFWDRLDIKVFVYEYPEEPLGGWAKHLITGAHEHGLEFMKASFADGAYAVDHAVAIREAIVQSYVNMKLGSRHGGNLQKAKDARAWADALFSQMSKGADILSGNRQEAKSFLLRLETIDYSSDQRPNPDDVPTPDMLVSRADEKP